MQYQKHNSIQHYTYENKMKNLILLILVFICSTSIVNSQIKFDDYFIEKTLRVDYVIAGNNISETIYLKELKQEQNWGGSIVNFIDTFGYGNYKYEVYDVISNTLIYSRGFSSLFQEWQSTDEAKIMNRSFYQVNTMPFPKQEVLFVVKKRTWEGEFQKIFETNINPTNYFINKEKSIFCKSSKIHGNKAPEKAVDVAFISEGYTIEEMDKFRNDVKRISKNIFSFAPFDELKEEFNIYAVESPSLESGVDIPGKGIYKNTAANFSFYTFDIERYLTTSDIKSLHDIAANVPYDQIYVIVNSTKYGGGGFYNYYTCTTSDHMLTPTVAAHEFGHGFAGLADEYYTSDVAYNDFYNLKIEPWEPNITTRVKFEDKWKNMIQDSIPQPTPRKQGYENSVGLFEGGGYLSKGIYSPHMDCTMKSNKPKKFCPVCQRAIKRMVNFTIGNAE